MNCASDKKIIYKRHALRVYHKWVTDAKTIAPGSSDVSVEGRHYYRNIKINKEMFCALVQYRVEELTIDYNDMGMELKSLFLNLRRKPTAGNLNLILSNNEFQNLFRKILNNSHETESKMTVCFLRDISTLLAMVSAVREKNFERHLLAEREMVKYCFTLHVSNVKALKQQLRIYGCDPRDVMTGEELPKFIIENLLNADSIGNEKYLNRLQICKLLLALKVKRKPLKQYQ